MFQNAFRVRRLVPLLAGALLLAAACAPAAAPTPTPAPKPAAQPPAPKPAAPAPLATQPPAPKPAATTVPAAKPAATGPAQRGGTLRVGQLNEIKTLDPHVSVLLAERNIQRMIYGTLFDLDEKLNIVPGMAQSFETSADGLALTIKLRPGMKFTDGTDFNAQAVKFTFDRILDPATNSARRGDLAAVKTVEVLDPLTVKINLKQPDASLVVQLTDRSGMVLSPTSVKQLGQDFGRQAVGAGPFKLHEWVIDDHLTLKRNEGYWKKDASGQALPYLDEVVYRPVPDSNVRVANLRGGTIDVIDGLPGNQIATLKADANLRVIEGPWLAFDAIWLNHKVPPFDKKEVRQALAYAIDRSAIAKSVFFGAAEPAASPITPSSWAYDPTVKPIQRDVNKAKELLQKAGVTTVKAKALVPSVSPLPLVAQVVKEQAAPAGFNFDLEIGDNAVMLDRGRKKDFEVLFTWFSGRPDPDGSIRQWFHSKGGTNWMGYVVPKVDELIDKAVATTKIEERRALYSTLTKQFAEDQPLVFTYHRSDTKAMRAAVQNYRPIPDGIMRFEDVWLRR